MKTICGASYCDYCEKCPKYKHECDGCVETNGHPCQGECVAASCILHGGEAEFVQLKKTLIDEVNRFAIPNLHINDLNLLNGSYINLPYVDANDSTYKLLKNNNVYLANQIPIPQSDTCYGVACDKNIIVISQYGINGSDPKLLIYKQRD